jgi:transcriptional regulator with XRE-family HTH domain
VGFSWLIKKNRFRAFLQSYLDVAFRRGMVLQEADLEGAFTTALWRGYANAARSLLVNGLAPARVSRFLHPDSESRNENELLHQVQCMLDIRLLQVREAAGLTQEQVAQRMGVTQASLSRLRCVLTSPPLEWADDLDLVNEGAIAEQAVGQLLRLIGHGNEEPAQWYWSHEAWSSAAEVDYLGAPTGHVLPIDVKAGSDGAMRSLHVFMADRKLACAARINSAAPMVLVIDTKVATGEPVRYSLHSLPAYAVECLPRLAR